MHEGEHQITLSGSAADCGPMGSARCPAPSNIFVFRMADIREVAWSEGRWSGISGLDPANAVMRSEEHTSELQSLMRTSYAVFCLKKTNTQTMTLQLRITLHNEFTHHTHSEIHSCHRI